VPNSSLRVITLIYHLGLYNRPAVAAVPGDVSPTPLKKKTTADVLEKRSDWFPVDTGMKLSAELFGFSEAPSSVLLSRKQKCEVLLVRIPLRQINILKYIIICGKAVTYPLFCFYLKVKR
jgi:hypothetical protein